MKSTLFFYIISAILDFHIISWVYYKILFFLFDRLRVFCFDRFIVVILLVNHCFSFNLLYCVLKIVCNQDIYSQYPSFELFISLWYGFSSLYKFYITVPFCSAFVIFVITEIPSWTCTYYNLSINKNIIWQY